MKAFRFRESFRSHQRGLVFAAFVAQGLVFHATTPSSTFACDAVAVALGNDPVQTCPGLDADGNGTVDLGELAAMIGPMPKQQDSQAGGSPLVAGVVSINIGTASGAPGSQVAVDVELDNGGEEVVGTVNDFTFDPLTPVAATMGGTPDCTPNPAIGKENWGAAFRPIGCTPGVDCTGVRVLIISFLNLDPIPNGVLYTCKVNIDPAAPSGTYPLHNTFLDSTDSGGNPHTITATDGAVVVTPPLDHFKCYKAKDLKNPKFVPTTVSLEDQFGVNDGSFEVRKPDLFCTPADKNGEGINNSVDHLTCYKMKGPKLDKIERPSVEVVNQLGTVRLQARKPFLVCVPSTKTVLP